MEQMTFVAHDFEGPLDLLLYLISKHKLDIKDIEISSLLTQYLSYIEGRQQENLELDSSFIEMAARLIQIKTASLLPKHEDEAKELKGQLLMELMEYQACKLAAGLLKERWSDSLCYVGKGMTLPQDKTFSGTMSIAELAKATGRNVLHTKKKTVSTVKIAAILQKRIISIASRIMNLMRKLHKNGKIDYDTAFTDAKSRSHLVATFLGILEMVKSGRISVQEDSIILHRKPKEE